MVKYLMKWILMSLLTLFVLITVTFVMVRLVPGGPFDADIAEMTPEAYANLMARYGIDQPLPVQYKMYMQNLFKGDLGESLQYTGVEVAELIGRGLSATLSLTFIAVLVALIIGFGLGIAAALMPNTWVDRLCMAISTIGISLPNYVVAIGLMYLLALKLSLLPVTGLSSPAAYVMPVIALALNPIANLTKLVKTSLIDALNQDYVTMAKSKGLSQVKIVGIHAMKNALLPIVSYVAPMIANLLIGSFVVENMFTIPGIGTMLATSITNRDYTTLSGMIIFYGAGVLVFALLADLAYVFIDPRVKFED